MLSSSIRSASSVIRTTAIRGFATKAEVSHKPPIDIHGLSARYANATYVAASKQNVLDTVEKELLEIAKTASTSEPFRQFLENPTMSREVKTKMVGEMLKGKTCDVTLNLMSTLAGNARMKEINNITDGFVSLMKARRGEVEATITSAEPLTKAQADAVAAAMKTQVGKDKTVALTTKVDPSLIGGLQVQVGDQFLDLSVASRVDALSRTVV
mmetsp:Transcript_36054/g.43435  ORF Transcript_36054/g.43435 Transcript_36054/m.43435 type:complete len:212 (+) Transcript_36054:52-687(+)